MRSRLSQLDFNYSPPPGFDTRKVKGLVASLLALKPEDHGKSTALEIAAGGKLYNVVVEDERVGKDLLERGGIKKRVTLIPLNKIRAFKLSAEVRSLLPNNRPFAHNYLRPTSITPFRNYKTRSTSRQAKCDPRYRLSATQMK